MGDIIIDNGVRVDPFKLQSMLDWPIPKLVKALGGFLGLIGYYKKFISGYGLIVAPLTLLLKNNAFHWFEEVAMAFQASKTVVSPSLVLRLPNFFKEFTIECDAFGVGLGDVLMQDQYPITLYI